MYGPTSGALFIQDGARSGRASRFPWLLALSLLLWPATAAARSGKVVGVVDGDSMTVVHEGRAEQIRLWASTAQRSIRTSEPRRSTSPRSSVFAKMVEDDPLTVDRYGRTVAFVKVGDTVVNEDLIGRGLARVFTRYCERAICRAWKALEAEARDAEARDARRGLWSMPNAIPPWEFRRGRR